MRCDVITLFAEMFGAVTQSGITRKALEAGLWQLHTWNPRDFTTDNYRTVDDRPYGGGPGMVMLAEPLARAIDAAKRAQREVLGGAQRAGSGVALAEGASGRVVYLSPQGARLDHATVMRLAQEPALILLCGRYEGVDQRLLDTQVDEEVSIGDYVVSGGELAAMVLLDAIVRQLPRALGDGQSAAEESFVAGRLDYPQYTRPEVWRDGKVPEVLMSGHHELIRRWRLRQALGRTWQKRADLLGARELTQEERVLLKEFQQENGAGTP